jgi:hypothetical protein
MYAMRLQATRHARLLQVIYDVLDPVFRRVEPLWRRIGYDRLEGPLATLEHWFKGPLFDCRMCGRCVLSASGMTCPMNCPKSIRNGPCGGVRPDGSCEVDPTMRCAWVEAWSGSQRVRDGVVRLRRLQPPPDHSLFGTSAWLRHVREQAPGGSIGGKTGP